MASSQVMQLEMAGLLEGHMQALFMPITLLATAEALATQCGTALLDRLLGTIVLATVQVSMLGALQVQVSV